MKLIKFFGRCIKGFYMSLGMFCAVPLPFQIWDDGCMNLMLPCFPLVGIIVGALWWGSAELLLIICNLHPLLSAAILTIFPFCITGFLHLDGYMDTSDAVLSRRPLEDKLRILKDPHTGAFAVIMLAVLFILWFPAMYMIADNKENLILLMFITVVSRACSAFAIQFVPAMPQSGYANMFKNNLRVSHKVFVIFTLAVSVSTAYIIAELTGLITVSAVIAGFICAMAYTYNELKGISGDLAGFSLVVGELCGIFALSVCGGRF
jgi:adenosylcobinamide-GDP ribazoletransferase